MLTFPEYLQGTWNNHSPRRKRKLLLHRSELERLAIRVQAKGYTVVPLELYFIGGRAKLEIALLEGSRTGTSARHCVRPRTSGKRLAPWRLPTGVGTHRECDRVVPETLGVWCMEPLHPAVMQ